MRVWFSAALSLMLSLVAANAYADNAAISLLEKMTQAAQQLNYQGVFAYQNGQNLQSIRIIHRADAQGETERLVSLNGAAREVIRTNDIVTCIIPDGNKVNVSRRSFGRGFPSELPKKLTAATPYYQVELGQQGRVADRKAQSLIITPVDQYRYGYRLWVDQDTALLLKSELVDTSSNVLETFAFTSLETGVNIPDQALEPQISGSEITWHRAEAQTPANILNHNVPNHWRASWLPDGFELVALQTRLRSKQGSEVDQRVYSDGLSSVSVFIEKIKAHHSHLKGVSHVGAVNAFGTVKHAHFVTVVGEVPSHTVEKIGAAIEFDKSN